jgi:hypothetical protein
MTKSSAQATRAVGARRQDRSSNEQEQIKAVSRLANKAGLSPAGPWGVRDYARDGAGELDVEPGRW